MAHVPVLLIHGFPFDHGLWRHQLTALTDYECLAPDLRGAGSTPAGPSDEFSVAIYAADLISLLDESRVDRAVICGLSMGGYIAFELLRQIPDRIRALILCNTKAAPDTPDAKRGRDAMAAQARQGGARAIAAELVPKLLARETRERQPDVVREVTQMIERQSVAGIVGALRALRDRPDSTPLLARIRVPTLVIAGDDDPIAPAGGMEQMARAIPGAHCTVIRSAAHVSPLEQPRAVNLAVRGFLETLG